MTHRRILALIAGLLSVVCLLGDVQAEPGSVPPLGTPVLTSIPTPAMPPALIPLSGPHCADCKMVVPPFPTGYQLPSCPECKGTPGSTGSACPTCSTGSTGSSCPTGSPGKKVCASTEEVKKVTKPVYSTKEVEYCVPHCLGSLFGNSCGTVRTKTVLVKKLVTEEKVEKKCVVKMVYDPAPQPAVAPYPCAPAPTIVAPPVVDSQPAALQFGSPLPATPATPVSPLPATPAEKPVEQPTYLPAVR